MPIYKSINVNPSTRIHIWKIIESEDMLQNQVTLGDYSKKRLKKMKSEIHRRAYLCVRHLLAIENLKDTDVVYHKTGKPVLKDGRYVSISHSYEYAAIMVSNTPVGIDIEKIRVKVEKIATKFLNTTEYQFAFESENSKEVLTKFWCVKEAVYKLIGIPGLSFKNNISVDPKYSNLVEVAHENLVEKYFYNSFGFREFYCAYTVNLESTIL